VWAMTTEKAKNPEEHAAWLAERNQTVPAFESTIGLDGGKEVVVRKGDLDDLNQEIKEEHSAAMRYHPQAASAAALFAARAIRPDEIAALRRKMMDTVTKGLEEVDKVIMGTKKWTPVQARLFAILTERVLPKLSSVTVEESGQRKLEEMTVEELELMAMGKRKSQAVDAVLTHADEMDRTAEKHERRVTKAAVVSELALITAVDEAEKAYIARQVARPMADIEQDAVRQAAKPQPKATPDQVAKVRASHEGGLPGMWRRQGFTEEEIAEKQRALVEKRRNTKRQLREERLRRLAVRNGLDPDAEAMAKHIDSARQRTVREFRVHNAKGLRRETAIARERKRAERAAERARRRAEEPRIFVSEANPIDGVPVEEYGNLSLARLRELRPDLFEPQEASTIRPEDNDDE
jgi:hypothetical protein